MTDISIIRKPRVREKTGYSNSTIHRLEKAGLFPRRIKLGPRACGYLESEIDLWIRQRVQESRKGGNHGHD